MTLTPEQATIIIITGIVALVVLAILAPTAFAALITALERLIERLTELRRGDNPPPPPPK